MYYLKYRPRTIGEIDNSRVKETLLKTFSSKDLPHAFLFVGQKGTGKTSSARILAKAVNCLQNIFASKSKSIEPCNTCKHCLSIANSSFTDVVEMDAASNRGIEDVKNLIKETSFLPMVGRYRVFIIDEAHMITSDGFNALLKTLEEPPPTTLFVLATTNLEKVPKTIASRCVKVNFGRAKKADLVHMLERIAKEEKLTHLSEMFGLIAEHADYSFRDAAKLFEEIVNQKYTTKDEIEAFFGVKGKDNLLSIIEQKGTKEVFAWIHEFSESGGNFKILLEDLLEKLRILLLSKKGLQLEEKKLSRLSTSDIVFLIKLCMEAYTQLRSSPIESLPLEIAIAEFYNKREKK
jgi:DNA polymerase-3 subunit gamma/tau